MPSDARDARPARHWRFPMKLLPALALFAAAPAFASSSLLIDLERSWDDAKGDVDGYYAGSSTAAGATGSSLGVSFVNVSGLSNDASFAFTVSANRVGLDKVSAGASVPEPRILLLMLAGGAVVLREATRRRRQ
jgi:hypothetical protein